MTQFSVLKLLQRSSSQALRPDVPFYSVGKVLGPPSCWDFSGDRVHFSGLLDYYGNIQLEIGVREQQVIVQRVGVRMWEATSGVAEPKQWKMQYAPKRHILLDGFTPGLSLAETKTLLDTVSISYSEAAVANASETVVLLKLPHKTEMHFFLMGGGPALAEIQAYSEHNDA